MQKLPSPELIFDTITAYQRSAVLKAAIELDVFTAIGAGAATVEAIAKRTAASDRGIRSLADYLVVIGFLSKSASTYALTPDAAMFLDRRSPAYMGTLTGFLLDPTLMAGYTDVAAAVRKGGTVVEHNSIEAENPMWVAFAHSMAPLMMMPAQFIAELTGASEGKKWKVLDIAAGHGVFGITLGQKNPNAEIVALDWPAVLEVAQENAQKAGLGERFRKLPGDAMKIDPGEGYDLVLITNFLHHFDVPTCETFLRKVHRALKPGGRAVTVEFVPNDDRVSPPPAALFSMTMLVGTPGGDSYTFKELDSMFRNAGFSGSELHEVPMSPEHVIVSRK